MKLQITLTKKESEKGFADSQTGEQRPYAWYRGELADGLAARLGSANVSLALNTPLTLNVEKRESIGTDKKSGKEYRRTFYVEKAE